MTIKREDIKKLVMQQMLQESIQEEGAVSNWLNKFADKFKQGSSGGSSDTGASKNPNKKIEAVADFIQMAQRDKELSDLILKTKVGQAISPEQVKEALGQDYVKAMRAKKITDADLDAFIAEMSKNAKAKKMLAGLGLATGGDQTDTPQAAQAGDQQAQQQTPAAQQQGKPGEAPAQQQGGADDVIAVFKGKTKGPKGASDSLHTQLTRQFGNIPDGGKLITAISKDLLNQLKVNGLKVQEGVEEIEEFLLKEMINNDLSANSLMTLLKEDLALDYDITSQVFESLQEGEREKKRKEEHVRQLGFVFDNGEVNWKAFTAAVKDAKQKGEAKDDDDFIKKGLEKRKGEGEKDLGAAADVQNAKDAEQDDIAAAGQLASDTNPNPSQDAERTQSSDVPQPEAEPEQTQPEPASAPEAPQAKEPEKAKELGQIKGGETPDASFTSRGFDDKQKSQIIRTLASQGFNKDQASKVVNAFSDWLKKRGQGQQLQEGSGSAKIKELVSQFMKETNVAVDQKMMTALIDATVKNFGSPDKPQGPVRANTSATAGKMPDISQAAKTMGAGVAQKEPEQPKAEPTSGPRQSGQMVGRQQQISKAADAAFKMTTPAKAGFINVGEVVGRKLKAMAQLNAKTGAALVPMIPKMLKAIEGFLNYALAKSGKKDVKIIGGTKNAAALQKTVQQASQGGKGAIKAGVGAMNAQQKAKEKLKEALAEEIYNLLTGKNK